VKVVRSFRRAFAEIAPLRKFHFVLRDILVAKTLQGRDALRRIVQPPQPDEDVNDRLGPEARNRRAPHVLDLLDDVADDAEEARLLFLKHHRPAGIIFGDDDGFFRGVVLSSVMLSAAKHLWAMRGTLHFVQSDME
jgi:hypothetical protein